MFEARKLMSRMPSRWDRALAYHTAENNMAPSPTNPQKLVATGENILTLVEIITVD